MRVAILVGLLTLRAIAGLYEGMNPSADAGLSDDGQVHAFEGDFPPPPSWPG
jgi:hypothetical protein